MVNKLNLEWADCYCEFRRARASSQTELYEVAPKKQNAQDYQHCDNDDLDYTHFGFLDV
jgi:hypothetical protein